MKYLIFIFLFSYGFSFELSDLFQKAWQAGKTIAKEGNEPPSLVQKQFQEKFGDLFQKPKQEWERISAVPDTVYKTDTVYVKDTLPKQNSFENTDIILQEEDILIRIKNDSIQNLILWQ
jgi:hypothetical protein